MSRSIAFWIVIFVSSIGLVFPAAAASGPGKGYTKKYEDRDGYELRVCKAGDGAWYAWWDGGSQRFGSSFSWSEVENRLRIRKQISGPWQTDGSC